MRRAMLAFSLLVVSSCSQDEAPTRVAVVVRGTEVSPDRRTLTIWTTYPLSIFCGKQPGGVDVEIVDAHVAIVAAYVTRQVGLGEGDACTMECGSVTQSVTLDVPLADGVRFESAPEAEPGCGYPE